MRAFWDVFFEKLNEGLSTSWDWLNKPLPVVCVSIVTIFIFIITILNRTSFGRRAIKRLTSLADRTSNKVNELQGNIIDYESKVDEKVKDYELEMDKKVAIITAQFDFFETSIFSALSQIPNLKVRNDVAKFQEGYEAKKQEIAEIIGTNYKNVISEREEKIKMLEDSIEKLSEQIKELSNGNINKEAL